MSTLPSLAATVYSHPDGTPDQWATLHAALATQPDRADILGLADQPATEPPARRRALPRHGGGRRAVEA